MKKSRSVRSSKVIVQEPAVEYKIPKRAQPKSIRHQLIITPDNEKALLQLSNLLSKMEGVNKVEITDAGELEDRNLLLKMERNLKRGFASREKVMATIEKIIHQK
ncbi:MAG: hypothetical protein K2U26_16100 [Cyclobacteriaceae bacterium]|nr:hypothetical protein [Cyclobacteriaceae bacterium]